jgi:3-oxoacyl-[acyl-carrier protein] reductase
MTDEEFDRILSINVKGVFYALREAARRLADGGRIVNLSSSATRLMLPTYSAYSATKAAVEQLTRIFAKEIGARGMRGRSSGWRPWQRSAASANRTTSPESSSSW